MPPSKPRVRAKHILVRIAAGQLYSDSIKENVRRYLRWATAEFGGRGLAAMTGLRASQISHALHQSGTLGRDEIGPVFATKLAAGLGLEVNEILTGKPPCS